MSLLAGLTVLQVGAGLAAAVCGRDFADLGATVRCLAADRSTPLAAYLNHGKDDKGTTIDAEVLRRLAADADIVVCEGAPAALKAGGIEPSTLRTLSPEAVIIAISPFGQTGPRADEPATDLTLVCASGIGRMLTGQVDDIAEPPIRPIGSQSAFIGGVAAACAGVHGVLSEKRDVVVDISIQETLATLAITELTRASLHRRVWSRKRVADGNGATVTILPAKDGFVAISPREDHQWAAWLGVMGSPDWGAEPRFARKRDRVENWDALHELMSNWSRQHDKQWIADAAQAARVPSFPLRELAEQFGSAQLAHRNFYREFNWDGRTLRAPGPAYGISRSEPDYVEKAKAATGPLPLSGIRVLDFSWVIAGPTTTRYLAAMGAEVIKVEAPGRGDPGRASELHTVLGQAKKAVVLNLKDKAAMEIARSLAARSDIVIENFGTGIMERFGLGAEDLRRENPELLYISASGLGRTGPEAKAVAYGTLLQCYAGFAGLNRHPDVPPRVGMAWLDPMCGLKLALAAAAGIWRRRRTGKGVRIDFSMIEAMLWTMAEPILDAQRGVAPAPRGNASDDFAPHGVYPAAGEDSWVGIAVTSDAEWRTLCTLVPALSDLKSANLAERRSRGDEIDRLLAEWTGAQAGDAVAATLTGAGIPAAAVALMLDLVDCDHLRARGFWDRDEAETLPGLPWRSSFGRQTGPAPALGADTDAVLRDVLGMTAEEVVSLRAAGALG
jgi:crotonobetainyl-CoA:carnitine CoA-transferase CaiB-like acyl-CoA transferase